MRKITCLGECKVGDVIQGVYSKVRYKILNVNLVKDEYLDEPYYEYKCECLDGPFVTDTYIITSYQEYRKLTT